MVLFRGMLTLGALLFALTGHGRRRPPIDTEVRSQPTNVEEQDAPAGVTFPNFKPVEFPFVTVIPDDGTAPSGWQEAKVNLEFTRYSLPITVIKWYCPFRVGVPMRTAAHGAISPVRAATMSATVANAVDAGIDHKLPQGIFCQRFRDGMKAAFPAMYPDLGARVNL